MSNDNSILVLGAGELGMAMLRSLSGQIGHADNVSLAVLLRPSTIASDNPGKQKDLAELRELGLEFVAANLATQTRAELAAIFRRFDTVISCTGFAGGPGVQLKIAHATLDAGVRRYFPWQFGVDYDIIGRGSAQDLFDEQLDVRDLLRGQSQTEWVIVSTGMFTSFLFEKSFGVVDLDTHTVNALGSLDNAVTVTTADDIAALTTEILFATPSISNRVVHVAGDTVTYREVADTVDRLLGIKVQRKEWTVPELERQLDEAPHDGLRKYRVVFAQGRGVAWDKRQTFNAQRGIRVTSLEEWVRETMTEV
ncbi:aromatic alcohol reductase [Caballeronia sp. LZ033]|uniref:aromatic alcohol reductase n=1 Tax=Caballeronia sp. LZ033 TaxID=3038566 RepID=UPI00285762DA|nr:aromatic alcohol reductase [Caballeronia sp. LZ033]MDR5814122.1 aromatic alcohol reductase [Caballeronia sp. LZ033]